MNTVGKSIKINVSEALDYVVDRLESMRYSGGLTEEEYKKVKDIERIVNTQLERIDKL